MSPSEISMLAIGIVQVVTMLAVLLFSGGRRTGIDAEALRRVEAKTSDLQTAVDTANKQMSRLTGAVQTLQTSIEDRAEGTYVRQDLCEVHRDDIARRLSVLERIAGLRNGRS